MNIKKTVAIIPIRSGSKGLPNKNILPLAGTPLFIHSLKAARVAGVGQTVISTDIPDVLAMDLGSDARVFERPAEFASDTATMADVLNDLLVAPLFDDAIVILLQATSPLRQADDISNALAVYKNGTFDLVVSVCPADKSVLKYGTIEEGLYTPMRDVNHMFSNRQALPDVYRTNGAVYVFGADWFRANKSLETPRIGTCIMSTENSIDIDTASDLECAEKNLSLKNESGPT